MDVVATTHILQAFHTPLIRKCFSCRGGLSSCSITASRTSALPDVAVGVWDFRRFVRVRAKIERLMGTLMSRVHALPGTTFSNVVARGDYPAEQKAILTLR